MSRESVGRMSAHARFVSSLLLLALALSNFGAFFAEAQPTGALFASLLANRQQQQPQQLPAAAATATSGLAEQNATAPALMSAASLPLAQQQQQPAALVQQLGAMQAQAQRQFNQLVNSPIAANLTAAGAKYASNALEALSSVGKAIQQQLAAASNHHQIQIMAPGAATSAADAQTFLAANTKKNEYQSIQPADGQQQQPLIATANGTTAINYREQGEQLRLDIARRVGQLQQVVASSMDMMKNNGDLIVRRLLEQLNHRLDQAKSKADRIITEPATNEVAIKALVTINQGLNNLNNIITNIVNRLETSAKESSAVAAAANQQQAQIQLKQQQQQQVSQRVASSLFDTSKFRLNFQQLGQQFSSAFSSLQQNKQQSPPNSPAAPASTTNSAATGGASAAAARQSTPV